MADKDKKHTPITEDAEILGQMNEATKSFIGDLIKTDGARMLVDEMDEEFQKDPKFKKAYEDWEGRLAKGESKAVQLLKQEVESLTSAMLTMTIDPDMQRDSANQYDFPHERVNPVMLRRAGNSIPARMIKMYRFHQLSEFAKPSNGKEPGFRLKFIDEDRKVTAEEKKALSEWEMVFYKRFFFVPNEPRPNMAKWLQFAYGDFFDMDKVAFEVIRQNASLNPKTGFRGKPLFFSLVDGSTIFHILPRATEYQQDRYEPWRWDNKDMMAQGFNKTGLHFDYLDENRYVQVDHNGSVRQVFTEAQMQLHHAFGTTDIKEQFQGYSIVEQSLQIIRYILDSILYNATRRSAGQMPKGMIHVEGATEDGYSRMEMALFRKLIWGVASGKKDHWKYPIVGTPKGVKTNFIRFHESSKEMEDFMWFSTMLSIMCSFAGMSPEALELASQKNTLGKQRLFSKEEENGAEYRSQDEGLRFFLSYVAHIINSSGIVEEMTGMEGVHWEWAGLDVEDEAKKLEMDMKRLSTTESINDLLAAADKKPYTLEFGDVNIFDIPAVTNPQLQPLILQALQAAQQENMQDLGFGDEGDEGLEQYGEGGPAGERGQDTAGPDYLGDEDFDEKPELPDNDKNKKPGIETKTQKALTMEPVPETLQRIVRFDT